jgi:hypothetical protein
LQKEEEAGDYVHHSRVKALLSGRKYISLNANAMLEQDIDFADGQTRYLCILPIMAADRLQGYVIMEGDNETGPLVRGDAALLFISDTISYMLTKRDAGEDFVPQPAAGEEEKDESPLLKTARAIEGLDVDKGIFLTGGVEEQYGDLLRISAKVFDGGIRKMRSLYQADLPAFAIEVHGMKGALYAIGADGLGDRAKDLEFAAKAGDAVHCAEAYPAFEEEFAALAVQLGAIVKQRETAFRGAGNKQELVTALGEAFEASQLFNSAQAGKVINSLLEYSWEDDGITETLDSIADALENMDHDEAEKLISGLLKSLGVDGV